MNSLVGGKRRQRCWLPCHVARCVRMQGPAVESICSLTSLAYSASTSSSMGCADFPSFAELLHTVHLSTVFVVVILATSSRSQLYEYHDNLDTCSLFIPSS
jgi:hypothetical protein